MSADRIFLALLGLWFCATKVSTAEADGPTNLPVCYLTATNPISSQAKVPCTFEMVYPDGESRGSTNRFKGGVRIHGGVSQGYAKKSYGLTLDSPFSMAGLHPGAHWVLNAAYIDRSLMRHKLAYDLFMSLGATNQPRHASSSRFVEVYLNRKYNGVYLLMERVDWRLLKLHPFNSNDTTHACIYKAVDHSANFAQAGHPGYEQREPDPLQSPYWGPLDRFDRFVSSTSDDAFFNPENGIAVRLDLENAIDFHLLVLLTYNLDGIDKNFIIARDWKAADAIPKFFFVPWDYDGTFGRNWDSSAVPATGWLSNHLFDRLLSRPDYGRKFAARWKQLRAGPFSATAIRSRIDANVKALGPAADRNFRRWPVAQGPYRDRVGFVEDIAEMKSWTDARLAWLDDQIEQRYGQK